MSRFFHRFPVQLFGASVWATLFLWCVAATALAQDPATANGEAPPAANSPADTSADSSLAAEPEPAPVLPERPIAVPAAEETAAVHGPTRDVPIFLGGRVVSVIRSHRGGLSPEERAHAIRQRVDRIVSDTAHSADSIYVVQTSEGFEVRIGTTYLWTLTWEDVGTLEKPLQEEASELRRNVREGLEAERARRGPLRTLFSLGLAILLTFLLWILYRFLRRLAVRASAWARTTLVSRLPRLSVRNFEILTSEQVAGVLGAVFAWIHLPVFLVLLYFYLGAIFSFFPWTQLWGWILFDWARRTLLTLGGSILVAIPQLAIVIFVFLIARWLSNLAGRFFGAVESGTVVFSALRPELSKMNLRLVRVAIWLGALVFAYPFIPGSETDAFKGVSVLLGLMVSLGSTGLVGNAVGGIVLSYMHSYGAGDRVCIGENEGTVISLGFLATKLRSLYNEEITIPNAVVLATRITNYTRLAMSQGLLLKTQVTIGYDVPWRQVHELLIEAAGTVEGIEEDPAPEVLQRALNDHHVTYELRCATHQADEMLALYSRVHEAIQDAFAQAGVEILSPAFTNLRDANAAVLPDEPKGPRPEPGGFRMRPPK